MMKEEFKQFVSSHPELIKYVNNNQMTWQKFYDIYSLYGDKKDVWDQYFKEDDKTSVTDIVNMIKNMDIDTLQKNTSTINKALLFVSTLLSKEEVKESYTPVPLYKKFED